MKECQFCNKSFEPKHGSQIYCTESCRYKRYAQSEKGKISLKKRYNQYYDTIGGKKAHLRASRRFRKTDKYKDWVKINGQESAKKYRQSEKGKITSKKRDSLRKYHESRIIEVFTKEEWRDKLNKTEGYCPHCHKYIGIDKMTMDHIFSINVVPTGYTYTIDDVQPLCVKCNSWKGTNIYSVELQKIMNGGE